MEKKKCILCGFAILSSIIGVSALENDFIFGTETEVIEEFEKSGDEYQETNLVEIEGEINTNNAYDNENLSIENSENVEEIKNSFIEVEESEPNSEIIEGIQDDFILPEVNDINNMECFPSDENEIIGESIDKVEIDEKSNIGDISPQIWIDGEYGYGKLQDNQFIFYVNDQEYYSQPVENNSWVRINLGELNISYYIANDVIVTDKIMDIDGKKYGFNYEGVMYANEDFYLYDYENGIGGYYRADSLGSLQWMVYKRIWRRILL